MEDDRDWEDAAFNTRHLHNHNDRGGQLGNVRHEFQVRNTMGTHLIKCAALDRLLQQQQQQQMKKKTGGDQIYRLTDDEDGLLGSLRCGRTFEATVAFAGSRKTLAKITHELGGGGGADPTHNGEDDDGDDDDDGAASQLSGEGRRRQRVATFEKNSFRQPKFWFRWQGVIATDGVPLDTIDGDDDETSDNRASVHGSGYLVFSSNDCKRFQGTMTSEQMEWNNVKMTGWKTKPQPERDFEIEWDGEF
ncbi:hypothetical protein M406DRAFT_90750 [Cryphonectria parasitica EP155]|uniref:YTH domain-containing protein n=1 Tax=Cryphonectria parasitica (strain ATCC 38755 / EP155) TaxID=660469 RepID=A0A9P4Y2C2_CRYP1|nr:uncharacterized protein M406DRAFT_90750 [Cryphonectria parasitica EP155]KAF3765209.1 hypothetical protein M406DRAFT_90750 [Cryphonectria parasitica EP155]